MPSRARYNKTAGWLRSWWKVWLRPKCGPTGPHNHRISPEIVHYLPGTMWARITTADWEWELLLPVDKICLASASRHRLCKTASASLLGCISTGSLDTATERTVKVTYWFEVGKKTRMLREPREQSLWARRVVRSGGNYRVALEGEQDAQDRAGRKSEADTTS